jgi:prophage maintenance system killer protein/prophage antirepressor-like protein
MRKPQIVIYAADDSQVEVHLEGDTVWLNQEQMARLFGRERSVITRHVRNVFVEGELDEKSNVQNLHIAGSDKPVKFYNLDVIISVGYRVKSTQGTRFRQWATKVLREHLASGYTLDAQRLAEQGLTEVREAVNLLAQTLNQHTLISDEGAAVLAVVQRYLGSFSLLLAYDEDRLPAQPSGPKPPQSLTLADARAAIDGLRQTLAERGEATALFGREREHGLEGILAAIEQTMFGEPLYPSAQMRAAHLLYFVIKDHPFTDGNKRIGAMLFLDYLRRNSLLYRADGNVRFAENAIVALALLIAESAPAQKDLLIRLTLALMEGD